MKKISTLLLGAALTLGMVSSPLLSPAFAKKKEEPKDANSFKPELSKEFRAAIAPVDKAMKDKDFATAQTKLSEAAAVAKLPDEKFYVANFQLQLGQETKDQALQFKGIDGMLESGSQAAAPNRAKLLFYSGQAAYSNKDYPTAIRRLSEAEQAGNQNVDVYLLLAESYFKQDQIPAGLGYVERAVQIETAAGRKAPEDWYKRAASVAYSAKQMPEVAKWTRLQVAAYPTSENWRSALLIYRDTGTLDSPATLDLYRLMRASKAITSERDFYEYAQLASDRGLPGEAVAVIDEGAASGKLNKATPGISDVYKSSSEKLSADKASLPASEKASATGKDGKIAQSTAEAFLSYGNYAKAAELYKMALAKGNVDTNVVNTRLGIALALSGSKEEAKAAFAAVNGARTDLAKFWVEWLEQPVTGA
ncbi:tetratricopeptide repeat protein [Sphingomonas flavalba]|uniref:tetratricopeptide repeat protein n=1 Tax=Sphingomonas flavalba TaxID=2559804 RepID=UPI0039E1837F